MKILFVFAHPAPYKIDLFNGLAPHLDLTVVFERHASGFRHPYFYDRTDYRFRTIFLRGLAFGAENHFSFELIRHLRRNHYDLIVMNGYSSMTEIMTINYLQRKRRPYVLYVNGGVIHEDPQWRYRLKQRLISKARAYFSPTSHVDPYLIHYGAKPDRIIHYPYATISDGDIVSAPPTKKQRRTFESAYQLSDKPLFISAGQFIDRKNNVLLLEIWRARPHDEQLLLIGSGPDEAKYRRYIAEHNLTNVRILPYMKRSDLFKLIRFATALIILSKEDIYGHIVNESLSQGVPVISSRHVMAALHLIVDGKNGHLVDLDDAETIHHALDHVRNSAMFDACVATSKSQTLEVMVQAHLAAFQDLTT